MNFISRGVKKAFNTKKVYTYTKISIRNPVAKAITRSSFLLQELLDFLHDYLRGSNLNHYTVFLDSLDIYILGYHHRSDISDVLRDFVDESFIRLEELYTEIYGSSIGPNIAWDLYAIRL